MKPATNGPEFAALVMDPDSCSMTPPQSPPIQSPDDMFPDLDSQEQRLLDLMETGNAGECTGNTGKFFDSLQGGCC